MAAIDIASAEIGSHARFEMQRRGIAEDEVRSILAGPEKSAPVRPGRIVVQGPIHRGGRGGVYLLRVFVDVDRTPPVVVTAYMTSKLAKYRGQP